MDKHLCIHGHFYQPPREDPWLGKILPEGSAAPSIHWNERICRESYAPMAWARRLDDKGRITEIVNIYEWISFNYGPTLFKWMERSAPEHYARVIEADRVSAERWGKGNALAQVYHHVIMPLASDLDKELEVAWAVDDFTARFGRAPEGMWLAETAVDTETLEVLADYGLRFTVLAPSQAKAVAGLKDREWKPLPAGGVDISRPYAVDLPSGKPMAVFFYHGDLSQAVAFERLLADGEQFWKRMSGACRPGLLSLATDGETYGHHFKFGEMALAYALSQAESGRDNVRLTNYAAFLEANPPTMRVKLHEPSAWSCAHGVERWRSDCGCTTGGHAGWNQKWRAPLREALAFLKERIDAHYFEQGDKLFTDARDALVAYGRVLSGLEDQGAFAAAYCKGEISPEESGRAWKLLAMQQWALASFASCAWFFDEISRIEPVNGLTFALRAMDLARDTGMPGVEHKFTEILDKATSNIPEMGTGKDIWENQVKPRRETWRTLLTQAAMRLWAEGRLPRPGEAAEVAWPGVTVRVGLTEEEHGARPGRAVARWGLETAEEAFSLELRCGCGPDPFQNGLTFTPERKGGFEEGVVFEDAGLPQNKRQALADAWIRRVEAESWSRLLDEAVSGIRLVTELQEAQNTLTLAQYWNGHWAAMAWLYVWGIDLAPEREALLLAFLREAGAGHPGRVRLIERIAAQAAALLRMPGPDYAKLCALAERCAKADVGVDWWPVQNIIWKRGLHTGKGRKLAALVHFASAR